MRISEAALVRRALEDSIAYNVDLINCLPESDPHRKTVQSRVKQMRAVLSKYFQPRQDPLPGARLVPLSQILRMMRFSEDGNHADEG